MAESPKGSLLRIPASLAALALMLAALVGYTQLPALGGGDRPGDHKVTQVNDFHNLDRLEIAEIEGVGLCTRCHEPAAHGRDFKHRGFLNMHNFKMDCTACHLAGKGITPQRFDAQGEPSKNLADRIYAARRVEGAWAPLTGPGDGVRMVARGPQCKECHRRRSQFLSTPGLYKRFHRRILEDLIVLPAMEGRL